MESANAEIHGVLFRTELAERNWATQDSGIVATFTDRHRSSFKYGKPQNIYSVNIGGQQRLILRVNFFKSVEQDRRQGRRWVLNTGRSIFLPPQDSFIFGEKIDGQVFFAGGPERNGYLEAFQYKGSGYIIPTHHFDETGRLLDI